MNITRENIDALNAVLKVKVTETDYAQKVENAIKQVKKRIVLPGFRPGMAPASLIKKMHGKSILVDEINKLLSDELTKYIVENKLDVLGQPLPKLEEDLKIDWDNQKEFEFTYDLALAPQIELNFSANDKITYYNIKVDDKAIDDAINNLRRRFGKTEYPDTVESNDLLFIGLTELENDSHKEGGQHKTSAISLEYATEDFKNLVLGKKKEDTIKIIPSDWIEKDRELAHAFAFAKNNEALKNISFEMRINNISRIVPAELNQEFYDKVYGLGTTNGIEEFREKVKEELSSAYKAEGDKHFRHEVNHLLLNKFNLQLPDAFLKRWIKAVNEKPITDEQIEKEYPAYANSLKLQLIENKIIKENNIKVTGEEAESYTTELITDNFKRYGQTPDENTIKDTVKRVLQNEEENKRIYEKLYNDKLITYFLSVLGVTYKDVTVEEFNKELEQYYRNHAQ